MILQIIHTIHQTVPLLMSQHHNPIQGASWMLTAGLAFAIVNSLAQVLSVKLHLPSTTVAFIQYFIALIAMLPWLKSLGLRQALRTQHFGLHCFRVFLSVIGIQLWLWALAYPVPIWQGIALLMTSPLFATIGSGLFLRERVGAARWFATVAGFVGAMIILELGVMILAGPHYCQLGLRSSGQVIRLW